MRSELLLGLLLGCGGGDEGTDDTATEADETGGLDGPTAAVLGPEGRWYVASFNNDAVLRYEADGRYVDTFVPAGTDGGVGFGGPPTTTSTP